MVTREKLYEAVWTEPLLELAKRFEVSSSYLARVCDSLGVPRPDRGYWAKKAVGRAPAKPALPPALQGAPIEWSPRGGAPIRRSSPRHEKASESVRPALKTHGLLQGAVAHFAHGRKVEADGYLKPYKRHLVDVTCTKACLDEALSFANRLFLSLEADGYRVGIYGGQDRAHRRPEVDPLDDPTSRKRHNPHYNLWCPGRLTVAYVDRQLVGLSLVEVAETTVMRYVGGGYVRDSDYVAPRSKYHADSSWTTTMEKPSGRLRLHAYAPHHRVDLTQQWVEGPRSSLALRIPEIVAGIKAMAARMAVLVAQAELQMEAERREREVQWKLYERQENRRRIRESISASRDELDAAIRHWVEVRARSDFLNALSQQAAELPESERAMIEERLSMARELLGPIDPLAHFRAWRAPAEGYSPRHFEEEE